MSDKTQPRKKRAPNGSTQVEGSTAGVQTSARPANEAPAKSESKIEKVITLLRRPECVTLAELVAATGWQPHTTRAALTGLRKKGHNITSEKVDGVRRYRADSPR